MQTADRLLHTKLHLPYIRPGLVARPRLQARVAEGLRGPLTLVTAPAGFGKTTLVASCVPGCGMPVAWLSLDRNDNEPGRFLRYLASALQAADAAVGREAAQLLDAAQRVPQALILTSLINDLDAATEDIVLVLDDYQFIHSQEVHSIVAFLLEHCPRSFHLLIATRSDPSFPLARLRARGQTVELRAADLGFTEPEATRFLNEVMGLGLDGESIAMLEGRTEGWIAGLQMAALSMRNREDVTSFIEGFSGTNRYILDYLLEEVLANQSEEIQQFLLRTSILERLSAPLCDAVLEDEWEAATSRDPTSAYPISLSVGRSAANLEYLESANLFLVPLDDERIWYRYHHLFADLLRAQLQRVLGAQRLAQLRTRASDWHAQHGSILEAIVYASEAADDERVERCIEQNYMELVRRGEQAWLRAWTGTLSKELVHSRPWLCIYEAYSHSWFGELDEADALLDVAETRIPTEGEPDARAMRGLWAYVKSRVTAMRGDIRRAIAYCLAARQDVPDSNLALQLDTHITLGYEYFLSGDYARAQPILQETVELGRAMGAVINTVAAACLLARLYAVQGLLGESYDTYQVAARAIPEASGQHLGAKALVEMGFAEVLCERNDLDAAEDHVQRALAQLPFWGKSDDLVLAHITMARIWAAQARIADAAGAVGSAVEVVRTQPVFSEARYAAEVASIKIELAEGDLASAARWAADHTEPSSPDDVSRFEVELIQITRARVAIALDRPNQAIALLSRLATPAESSGRTARVIEILLLQAIALQRIRATDQALAALGRSLDLAQPGGYVRLFLDEGQPMKLLLGHWLARAVPGNARDYTTHLLSHFEAEPQVGAPTQESALPMSPLVDPLTDREMEVLHLIALGSTNKEIARQLVVAAGTVKAHTSSIYRKLDVANRTEAVARARQLRILS